MSGFETDYAEEQAMEVEALEAIYADAFTVMSEKPLEWRVHLQPTEGGMGEVNHERYPDEAPGVDVEVTKGLTAKQGQELLLLAQSQAQGNVGMAMGYTIAECLKDWLADNNVPSADDGSMHGEMLRRMAEGDKGRQKIVDEEARKAKARAEDEEDDETIRRRRQADGTPVSPETFSAWKAAFDLDMRGGKAAAVDAVATKLTGKEMFLRHLVVEEDNPEGEGDEAEDLVVGEEGAFLDADDDDLDDEDLDDLSDGEEEG